MCGNQSKGSVILGTNLNVLLHVGTSLKVLLNKGTNLKVLLYEGTNLKILLYVGTNLTVLVPERSNLKVLLQCSKLMVHSAPGVHIFGAGRTFFRRVRPTCAHLFTQL